MVPLNKRERVRDRRRTAQGLAVAFLLMPVLSLGVMISTDRGFDPGTFLGTALGGAVLLWQSRRPAAFPEHLAAVDRLDDGTYTPWCDCLWTGEVHSSEDVARIEARTHTEHVREGLHVWGD